MQQDLLVAERQVDVPLQRLHDVSLCSQALTLGNIYREGGIGALLGNLFHREGCLLESLIHLIAYLEMLQRDTRTYHCLQLLWLRMIGESHLLDGLVDDACQRASPSGMDGCHGMVLLVIEQDWDAVGGGNTYAYALLIGHHGIYALENHLADVLRH